MKHALRLVLYAAALSAAITLLVALSPPQVSADNCDLVVNPTDCQNTAWVLGWAVGIAGAAAVASSVIPRSRTGDADREDEQVRITAPGGSPAWVSLTNPDHTRSTTNPDHVSEPSCDRLPACRRLVVEGTAANADSVTVNGESAAVYGGRWEVEVPITRMGAMLLTATTPGGAADRKSVQIQGSLTQDWCVRVVGSTGFDVPGNIEGLNSILDGIRTWFKVGPVAKALMIEIKSPETGETGRFVFVGFGVGAGIGRASASTNYTPFRTASPVFLEDFAGGMRMASLTAGVGGNVGEEIISFYNAPTEDDWWSGEGVSVGGVNFGTGLDISWVNGTIRLIRRSFRSAC